jgi:hypothetical protein
MTISLKSPLGKTFETHGLAFRNSAGNSSEFDTTSKSL